MKKGIHTLSEIKLLRTAFEVISDMVRFTGTEPTMLNAFRQHEPYLIFEENRDYEKQKVSADSYAFIIHHHLIEAEILFTNDVAESARMFINEDAFKQLRHTLKLHYIDDEPDDSMYAWRKLAFGFIQELHFKREDAKAAFIHAPFGGYQIIFSGVMEIVNKMRSK